MVESLHDEIMALGPETVELGVHYYLTNDPISVSPDRKTTILAFVLAGNTQEATGNVEDVVHIVQEANEAADFRVLIGGDASVAFENNEMSAADLEKGERFGIPIALIILLVLFGTIVAIFLPLGIAIVAIMLALAAVGVIGQFFQLIFFVTMIGLAVGIDYSLLIVSRVREEMSSGLDKQEAISKTGDTAGRTVLFSGTTVVVALLGMLIVPVSFFQSLGLGAILVVIAALAATLTLLPAVLSLLGSRVNFLSIPFLARFSLKSPQTTEHGFWVAVTRVVTRYPIVSVLLIGVSLIALTYFYFGIKTGLNDVNTFPDSSETKAAFTVLEEEFSVGEVSPAGVLSPAEIVIDGDIDSTEVAGGDGTSSYVSSGKTPASRSRPRMRSTQTATSRCCRFRSQESQTAVRRPTSWALYATCTFPKRSKAYPQRSMLGA